MATTEPPFEIGDGADSRGGSLHGRTPATSATATTSNQGNGNGIPAPASTSAPGSLHYAFKQLVLKGEDTVVIELRQEWPPRRGPSDANLPHVADADVDVGDKAAKRSDGEAKERPPSPASHHPQVPGCGAFQHDGSTHYSLFGVFDGHCGGELAKHCARNAGAAVRAALSACRSGVGPSSCSGCGPPPRGALEGCDSCGQGLGGRRGVAAAAAAAVAGRSSARGRRRRSTSRSGRETPPSSADDGATALGDAAARASDDEGGDEGRRPLPPSPPCDSCAGAEACEAWRSSLQRSLAAAVVSLQASWAARGALGGSTATLLLVAGRLVTCANVGDSAAFADDGGGGSSSLSASASSLTLSSLASASPSTTTRAVVALTGDHRVASNPAEASRVSRHPGACVASLDVTGRGPAVGGASGCGFGPLRVWGNVGSPATTASDAPAPPGEGVPSPTGVASVANARALGDVAIPGLLPLPLVTQCRLPSAGGRVLVGSDGIWDCVDAPRAARAARGRAAPEAADAVLSASLRACPGGVPRDDATVVVVDVLPRGVPSFPEALGRKLRRSASRAAALSAAGLSHHHSHGRRHETTTEDEERGGSSSAGSSTRAGSLAARAMHLGSPSPSPSQSPSPSAACSPRRSAEGGAAANASGLASPAAPVPVPIRRSASSASGSALAGSLRGGFGSLSIGFVGTSAVAAAAAATGGSVRSGSGRGGILAFGSAWEVAAAGRSLDDDGDDEGEIGVGFGGEAPPPLALRRSRSGGGSGRGGSARRNGEATAEEFSPSLPSPSSTPPEAEAGEHVSLPSTPQPRQQPPLLLPPLPPTSTTSSSSSPAPVSVAAAPPLPSLPPPLPAVRELAAEQTVPPPPPPQSKKKKPFSFLVPKKVREKREAREAAAAAAASAAAASSAMRQSFPSTSELSPTPPCSPSPRTAAAIASDGGGGGGGRAGAGAEEERGGGRHGSKRFGSMAVPSAANGGGRLASGRPPPHSPGGVGVAVGGRGILGNVASREYTRQGSAGFHGPSPSLLDAEGESLRGGTGFFASLAESVRGGTAFFDGSRSGGGESHGGERSVRRGVAFFSSVRGGGSVGAVSEGIAVLSRVDTARAVEDDDDGRDDDDGDEREPPSWLDRDASLRERLRECVREALVAYAAASAARARGEGDEVDERASSVSTSAVAAALAR